MKSRPRDWSAEPFRRWLKDRTHTASSNRNNTPEPKTTLTLSPLLTTRGWWDAYARRTTLQSCGSGSTKETPSDAHPVALTTSWSPTSCPTKLYWEHHNLLTSSSVVERVRYIPREKYSFLE